MLEVERFCCMSSIDISSSKSSKIRFIFSFSFSFHIKSAEETATSSASLEESAGAFYYFVINFVSLKPTGGLVPSENSQLRDNAVAVSQRRCNAALRQCYPEVSLFRALSLPDRTV